MGVNAGAKTTAKRRDKTFFISQSWYGKVTEGNWVSRGLEPDPTRETHGSAFGPHSPTHSPLFQRGGCCFNAPFQWVGGGPCPSLQTPTLHSCRKQCPKAQSPQHRAGGGAAEGEHEPHSCPWPELPSDTEYCGASGPLVPNSAPLPLPSLCGGDSCCGGEDGCGEKQGEREGGAESQSHILLCSTTSSLLCKVGGGCLGGQLRTQGRLTSNFCPLLIL